MTTQPEAELIFQTIGSILSQLFTLTDGMMLGNKSVLDYFIAIGYFDTAISFMKKLVSSAGMSDSELRSEERNLARQKGAK